MIFGFFWPLAALFELLVDEISGQTPTTNETDLFYVYKGMSFNG
jgi:hypothetical protein